MERTGRLRIFQNFSLSKVLFRSRFFQVLWLLLFALALIFYYRWQTPLQFVARNLIPLPLALCHLFAITGIGWPLARALLRSQSKSIEFFVSLAFGMGLTAIWSFSLGLLGNFEPVLFALWECAGGILFVIACLQWRTFQIEKIVWTPWEALGAAILALFLTALIPFVVAPEISTDSIAYHLLIPKLYLLKGKIEHLPLFVEAYYPSLAEYNYLPLLFLSNEIVCKSFHFWIGIIVLIFLSHLIKRISPGSGRLLAPALFLSMPVTAIHLGWAWNDFIYTLFLLLSLFFLFSYHQGNRSSGRDLFIAGLLAGLSSWTKYTFVIYFFTTLLILWVGYRRWKWRAAHYYLFFLGIGFVAPFWLIQNWMFTENPFYPFLNQVFQSPYWTENADRFFHNALRNWEIADWKWTTYFTFPVHMTMKARLVDIQTGILPLLLLPLLFLRSSSDGIRFLKVYVVACTFVWLFIHTENRSVLSVFALLFCVSAITMEQIQWAGLKIRNIMIAAIWITVCTNFYYTNLTIYHLFDPFRYFFGRETAEQYRSRLSESQLAFDYVNKAQDVGKVLLVSIHVPYYLNRPYLFSSFADPPIAEVLSQEAGSVEALAQEMHLLGVTHVIFNRSEYQRENQEHLYSWPVEKRIRFEEFLLKHCEPEIRFGNDYVFRVKNAP